MKTAPQETWASSWSGPPMPTARGRKWGRWPGIVAGVVIIGLIVALVVQSRIAVDQHSRVLTLTSENSTLQGQLGSARSDSSAQVADLKESLQNSNATVEDLNGQVASLRQRVTDAQAAADSAYARALKQVKGQLADREAAVTQREQAVTQREDAVKQQQGTIDRQTFSDGTYRVGSEIQAGTYRADGGSSCYWERLSGFGGSMGDIIANGGFGPNVVVTINPSDAGFSSSDCGTWVPIG